MDEIKKFIFIFILVVAFLGLLIYCTSENSKYIYECIDYKGSMVYCTYIRHDKSGVWGKTIDGTTSTITSYKRVLKEEQ